jgi:hypothetical protein
MRAMEKYLAIRNSQERGLILSISHTYRLLGSKVIDVKTFT